MKKIKIQYEKVKFKIQKQLLILHNKICNEDPEIEQTNQETALLMSFEAVEKYPTNPRMLRLISKMHDRIAKRLDASEVEIIRLRFYDGKTMQEIAELKGMSTSWVHMRLNEILNKLRNKSKRV